MLDDSDRLARGIGGDREVLTTTRQGHVARIEANQLEYVRCRAVELADNCVIEVGSAAGGRVVAIRPIQGVVPSPAIERVRISGAVEAIVAAGPANPRMA